MALNGAGPLRIRTSASARMGYLWRHSTEKVYEFGAYPVGLARPNSDQILNLPLARFAATIELLLAIIKETCTSSNSQALPTDDSRAHRASANAPLVNDSDRCEICRESQIEVAC